MSEPEQEKKPEYVPPHYDNMWPAVVALLGVIALIAFIIWVFVR